MTTNSHMDDDSTRQTNRRRRGHQTLSTIIRMITTIMVCWLTGLMTQSPVAGLTSTNTSFSLHLIISAGIRGHMMPIKPTLSDCSQTATITLNSTCVGGISRRSAYIAAQKALYPNASLAIDPGNALFGTLFATIDQGITVGKLMKQANYDVLGIGTVEFFGGPSMYGNYLTGLGPNVPIVCSNIDVSLETAIPTGRIQPYTILTVGTHLVGVVGCVEATLSTSSSAGPRISVNGNYTCANWLARSISEMKRVNPAVSIIIAMDTPNYNSRSEAYDIATTVEDVDIVVTENQPNGVGSMAQVTNLYGDQVIIAAIPYVTSPVYILGGSMVHLQVDLDVNGRVVGAYSTADVLDQTFPDDPALWNVGSSTAPIQAALTKVAALSNVVVGKLTTNLTGSVAGLEGNLSSSCGMTGCSIGMFVTSDMLDWCTDCDISHINSGGLRADLTLNQLTNPPDITRADVLNVLQYSNTLVSYNIDAKDFLREVIQQSVAKRSTLGFQQFSGLRVGFNPGASTVVYIEIFDRKSGVWRPYDEAAVYKVTTILFILNGGDGYNISPYARNVNLFGVNDAENVISSLAAYPNRTYPTTQQLKACWQPAYEFVNSWIAPTYCSYANSLSIANLALICPTLNDTSFCSPGKEVYDGMYFNSSANSCKFCSGLGTCAAGGVQTCVCDGPSTEGLFAGLQMIQGKACEQIRSEYPMHPVLRILCLTISGLTCLLCIGVSIFFYVNRLEKVIKRSSTTFLQLCCLGALVGGISAIFITLPTTSTTCIISDWLGHVGFILLFGSLYVKTQRIWQLFSNHQMRNLHLTDSQMLYRLGFLLLGEISLRVIETLVSPLTKTATAYGGTGGCAAEQRAVIQADWEYWFQCRSSHWFIFDALKWGTKICLTLYGVVLAILVRDIDKNYNESKFLGVCIYNMAIFAGLCKAAVVFLDNTGPSATVGLTVLTIDYIICFTLLGLAVPKWLHLRNGDEDEMIMSGDGRAGTSKVRHSQAAGSLKLTKPPVKKKVIPAADKEKADRDLVTPSTPTHVDNHSEPSGSTPSNSRSGSLLNSRDFQSMCTKHQQALSGMPSAERRGHLSAYILLAQQFLRTLQALKDPITAIPTDRDFLNPIPRATQAKSVFNDPTVVSPQIRSASTMATLRRATALGRTTGGAMMNGMGVDSTSSSAPTSQMDNNAVTLSIGVVEEQDETTSHGSQPQSTRIVVTPNEIELQGLNPMTPPPTAPAYTLPVTPEGDSSDSEVPPPIAPFPAHLQTIPLPMSPSRRPSYNDERTPSLMNGTSHASTHHATTNVLVTLDPESAQSPEQQNEIYEFLDDDDDTN